jgi:hypothetical protein
MKVPNGSAMCVWRGKGLSKTAHLMARKQKRARRRQGSLSLLQGTSPMTYQPLMRVHFFFFFWWDRGLNSELSTCKAGTLLLEPHLQSRLHFLKVLLLPKPWGTKPIYMSIYSIWGTFQIQTINSDL